MTVDTSGVVLTDKIVSERLELLTKAAAVGDANNAMTSAVRKARDGELAGGSGSEATVKANQSVIENWLPSQQKILAEGKDPNAPKQNAWEVVKSFWNDGIFSAIATYIGDSKIALLAESAVESFTSKDKSRGFNEILAEKTQEHKIRTFAAKHGIDGDRLLADIKNLPPETERLASITPEEQKNKLLVAEQEKAAAEEKKAKAAEDAEVARQVRLAREVEQEKKRIQAQVKAPEQQDQTPERKGSKDTKTDGRLKKPASYDLTDAKGELEGVASHVSNAGHGDTPPPSVPSIAGAKRDLA